MAIENVINSVKKEYQILEDLHVEVNILNNPFDFEIEKIFQMAARINKKRSFLFVNNLLGKHIAVNPKIPLLVGNLLSMRYSEIVHGMKDPRMEILANVIQTGKGINEALVAIELEPIPLPKPTTFIGFAETATALGHSVFSAFIKNAKYIHTTRENIQELSSLINFEEEHSHATSHRVYATDHSFFYDESEVVLVDDEITTGNTAINIIRTLKSCYPKKRKFTVISILDWRTVEFRQKFNQLEEELDIRIHVVSLVDGSISVKGWPKLEKEKIEPINEVKQKVSFIDLNGYITADMYEYITSINPNGIENQSPFLKLTGRFGLDIEEERFYSKEYKNLAELVKKHRKGSRTLVIGTGEFMYVPMKIASRMGSGVVFQSTTRSPIYQTERHSYTIHNKFTFDCPENGGTLNFLYNIFPEQYDEIFIFIERVNSLKDFDPIIHELKRTKIPLINIVLMSNSGNLESAE